MFAYVHRQCQTGTLACCSLCLDSILPTFLCWWHPYKQTWNTLLAKAGVRVPSPSLWESSLSFCRDLYCHGQLGILFPTRPVLFLVTHVLHTVSKSVLMVFYHIIFFSDVAIKYLDKNNLKVKAHHGGPSMTAEAGSWLMALDLHTELELKTRSQWLIFSSKAPPTDSTVF